ncbi:MAG: hypothetical protein KAT35_00945 [Candidatus Aenigmarchaeota archaeon]|nr:hypothetical protein [Candidatus Aenigmarchaeota archaeon]
MPIKKKTVKKKVKATNKVAKPVRKVKRIRRIPKRVPDSKAFWLKSDHGKIVGIAHNTKELVQLLTNSRATVFSFHTGPRRNDFAHWIEDALGDKALADKARKCRTKKVLVKLLTS